MAFKFNADEIFEMAERIEENGAKFYRDAAAKQQDVKLKGVLLKIADMEDVHKKTFHSMRNEFKGREKESLVFDPNGDVPAYLQAMADGYVFNLNNDPVMKLKGNESLSEIFWRAVYAEKNSIAFYSAIRNMVSAKAGKDKLDEIIKEELSHIGILNSEWRSYR